MTDERFVCPKCNSKDYEIEERFIQEKRQDEYSFRCLNCNYKITSLGNFQKINRECNEIKYKEISDERKILH